jgi:excisionase family DNA binding protein
MALKLLFNNGYDVKRMRYVKLEEKKYQLLTLKEAAEYLRMHKGSLYRLLESGKTDIPAIKLGGKWLFNLESLNKYLTEKEMHHPS